MEETTKITPAALLSDETVPRFAALLPFYPHLRGQVDTRDTLWSKSSLGGAPFTADSRTHGPEPVRTHGDTVWTNSITQSKTTSSTRTERSTVPGRHPPPPTMKLTRSPHSHPSPPASSKLPLSITPSLRSSSHRTGHPPHPPRQCWHPQPQRPEPPPAGSQYGAAWAAS